MTRRKKSAARRSNIRFQVQDGAFAEVKDPSNKLGRVIDISKGGLAFYYIDIGGRPDLSFELDMTIKSNGFHLRDIPLITTSDFKVELSYSSTPIRRRGGQFGEMNRNQISGLEYFIQHYITGESKDRRSGMDRRQINDSGRENPEKEVFKEIRLKHDRRKS